MHRQYLFLAILVGVTALSSACGSPTLVIQGLVLDARPSEAVPLAAQVTFETALPTTVALEFDDGIRSWTSDVGLPAATRHVVPILGMRPDRTHSIRVVVTDESGLTATSELLEITTSPLPEPFPPIDVSVSEPDRMEPGVTIFSVSYRPEDGGGADLGLAIGVDEAGEVVWYYTTDHGVRDVRRLDNGHIQYLSRAPGEPLYEIDMLGNVVSKWHPNLISDQEDVSASIHVDTPRFHHEAFRTATGNILTSSADLRTYEAFPTSDSNPNAPRAAADLIGDTLIEFTPEGEIVREVKLLDLIDPYRIGYGSIGNGAALGNVFGPPDQNPRHDWAHLNAVVTDDTGRYAIVSLRHQDAVLKVDMQTEELVWILGNHSGWGSQWQNLLLEPQGDMIWNYHQHAPMITPMGTLLMFGNGNNRASPFEQRMTPSESFSRAVEYRVDEENMQVTEVWSYGGPGDERFFANFQGDADWMPQTSNVLIAYGGMVSDAEGIPLGVTAGHNWARIVEVTHDTPAEKVFELFIDDQRPEGWSVYRAERLPSLYPIWTAPSSGRSSPIIFFRRLFPYWLI